MVTDNRYEQVGRQQARWVDAGVSLMVSPLVGEMKKRGLNGLLLAFFLCLLAVQILMVSACSDAQDKQVVGGVPPLDPVAREMMQRKAAEETAFTSVSTSTVSQAQKQPVVDEQDSSTVTTEEVVVLSDSSAITDSVPQPVGVSGLPDSFRLVPRSEADPSALAAHAAADAAGVPDIPQSRLLTRDSAVVSGGGDSGRASAVKPSAQPNSLETLTVGPVAVDVEAADDKEAAAGGNGSAGTTGEKVFDARQQQLQSQSSLTSTPTATEPTAAGTGVVPTDAAKP